jgi:hypothetical protein
MIDLAALILNLTSIPLYKNRKGNTTPGSAGRTTTHMRRQVGPTTRRAGGPPPFSRRLGSTPNSGASGRGWRRDDIHAGPPVPTPRALPRRWTCAAPAAGARPDGPAPPPLPQGPPSAMDAPLLAQDPHAVGGAGAASVRRGGDGQGPPVVAAEAEQGAMAVGAKPEQEEPHSSARTSCSSGPLCYALGRRAGGGGRCDNPPRKVPYYRLRPIHFGH